MVCVSSFADLESNFALSPAENMDKTLDVFVSYRRSNGSQLASLLKVSGRETRNEERRRDHNGRHVVL